MLAEAIVKLELAKLEWDLIGCGMRTDRGGYPGTASAPATANGTAGAECDIRTGTNAGAARQAGTDAPVRESGWRY